MKGKQDRVVVAMSGGVDSAVSAALLKEAGHDVIGMMLRLWSESGRDGQNRCCTPEAMALAKQTCAQLEIPFYVLDVREKFFRFVVQDFIDGYSSGITPNPCIACNRLIRFGVLLDHALTLNANYLATGHYARLDRGTNGSIRLMRAIDRDKDQSYVLSILNQDQLKHALFPVGAYTKSQVRQMATRMELPIADRADSQDLCFLAGENYRDFLKRFAPEAASPGPIYSSQGEVLGEHQGLANYTIGQRKGLGIAAPYPFYVIQKDRRNNAIIVGKLDDLGSTTLTAQNVNWVSGSPPTNPIRSQVKIRYRAQEAKARIEPLPDNHAKVVFDQPLRDITPGQAVVFYSAEECLGGGIIQGNSDQ